jgi:hypothetical protein
MKLNFLGGRCPACSFHCVCPLIMSCLAGRYTITLQGYWKPYLCNGLPQKGSWVPLNEVKSEIQFLSCTIHISSAQKFHEPGGDWSEHDKHKTLPSQQKNPTRQWSLYKLTNQRQHLRTSIFPLQTGHTSYPVFHHTPSSPSTLSWPPEITESFLTNPCWSLHYH